MAVVGIAIIGIVIFLIIRNREGAVQEVNEEDFYEETPTVSKKELENFNPVDFFGGNDNKKVDEKNIEDEDGSKTSKGRHF